MEKIISVPDERVGFVVGKEGQVKKNIETTLHVRLEISEGTVKITGESLDVMKAVDIVKAIGLGFPKEEAFDLFRDEIQMMVLDLTDAVSESQLRRVCGRIIGERGKTKSLLEKKLRSHIIVTGDEVAAIGSASRLQIFREVIEKIVRGASHASAYKHLDRKLAMVEKL